MEFIIPTEKIERIKKSYNNTDKLNKYMSGVIKTEHKTEMLIPSDINTNTLIINFNNLAEVFQLVDDVADIKTHHNSSHETSRDTSWTKYATYDEAYDVLRHKPHEVATFNANDIVINDYNESGNQVDYDVVGDFIDVGRYLDGVPEAFGSMRMGSYRGVRVKIFMCGGSRASTDIGVINERSKRATRLVDWLENQGIRVSFNVVFSNECGHFDIRVKDYAEPLNIYDVAVATNGDFFRRMVFRLEEMSKTITYGYGSAVSFNHYLTGRLDTHINNDSLDNMVVGLPSDEYSIDEVNARYDRLEKHILELLENNNYKQYVCSSLI